MYDPAMVQPMRDELTEVGVKELFTAEDVKKVLDDSSKTTLLFVNSVCGCAAGQARPGLIASLNNKILPDNIVTAFAGMEKEAVQQARSYFIGYPPSSPCLAVFRDGEMVHFLQRTDFLNKSAESISEILKSVYNKYCGKEVDESVKISDGNQVDGLEITPTDVKKMLDKKENFFFLDVREPQELQIAAIKQATLLDRPLAEKILNTFPKDTKLVFTCHHGNRSLQAARYFKSQGFKNSLSMSGGIEAWSNKIDPSIALY